MAKKYGTDRGDTLFFQFEDQLYSGSGNDSIWVLTGSPPSKGALIDGGTGRDTLRLEFGDGLTTSQITKGVSVDLLEKVLQVNSTLANARIVNIEDVIGTDGNDSLYGDNHGNKLIGGNGNDLLQGRGGNDFLVGGEGKDTLYGDDGNDTLVASFDDKLYGGTGNDLLVVSGGGNILSGGSGRDIFDLDAIARSETGRMNTITDFKVSEGDKLNVTDLLVGYNAAQKAINDFVSLRTVGNDTIVAIDVNGKTGGANFVDAVILQSTSHLTVAQVVDAVTVV